MNPRPRILLADDHRVLTDALTPLLREHFDVVGAFSNGRELLEHLHDDSNSAPDVVMLDISMPEMNGLETARRIKASSPSTSVVFLSMHNERPYVEEAFRAGASAYILKREALGNLINGVNAALRGERYVSPSAAQPNLSALSRTPDTVLTQRQREILQLIAEGKTAKDIASALNISPKTAEFHKAAIMDRLGVRTTAGLVKYAIEHFMAGA